MSLHVIEFLLTEMWNLQNNVSCTKKDILVKKYF